MKIQQNSDLCLYKFLDRFSKIILSVNRENRIRTSAADIIMLTRRNMLVADAGASFNPRKIIVSAFSAPHKRFPGTYVCTSPRCCLLPFVLLVAQSKRRIFRRRRRRAHLRMTAVVSKFIRSHGTYPAS